MTEEQKIPEDVFKEVEKTVLDILRAANPERRIGLLDVVADIARVERPAFPGCR